MIIGYDFWGDFYDYDETENASLIIKDNDGVAFDTCNPLKNVNEFTLQGGTFDELHITKDSIEIDNTIEKTDWTINTVLLAKFQNSLVAGTIGIDGRDMYKIELRKRRKGEYTFQTYFSIDFDSSTNLYTIIDKLIENEEEYEYCIRGVAKDDDGNDIYSNDSSPAEIYISYEHAHLFDSTGGCDLIYDLHIDNISNQIGANTIETLGSQYPYVIYGQANYLTGSIECLLVSEESATGSVNIRSEKELRKKILAFLNNKQCKVLKNEDGLYMLIEIIGTPTLIPSNEIIGVYQVNFQYIQIGNVDNIIDLQNANITFDYLKGSEKIKDNALG
jgi:hypothetical protein